MIGLTCGGGDGPVPELAFVSVNVAQPSVLLRWPGGDVISGIGKQPVSANNRAVSTT